jgi:hypothetical protein
MKAGLSLSRKVGTQRCGNYIFVCQHPGKYRMHVVLSSRMSPIIDFFQAKCSFFDLGQFPWIGSEVRNF